MPVKDCKINIKMISKMLFIKMKEGIVEVFSDFKLFIGFLASSLARMNTVVLTVNYFSFLALFGFMDSKYQSR